MVDLRCLIELVSEECASNSCARYEKGKVDVELTNQKNLPCLSFGRGSIRLFFLGMEQQ